LRRSWGDIGGRGGGGPSRKTNIGVFVALIESGALALALSSCGEKPEPPVGTPSATRPPALQEPDQGDERGVRVDVAVRVTRRAIRVDPRTVAGFLPVRYAVRNATKRRIVVRISRQPPLRVAPGLRVSTDSPGEKPGRVRISAGGRRATLRVKPGG
jgi:hypothetical protein